MTPCLYYIHDPMCSWCWGFRPVWESIQQQLPPLLPVQYVVGGLAADTNELMSVEMQQYVVANWQRIQQVIPGTNFNYDFWCSGQPRRSTYPACRAVIAAKQQGPKHEINMIAAIQEAYYLQAKNPSDNTVLIALAEAIGLDVQMFSSALTAPATQQLLDQDLALYQQLSQRSGASGFPSLILQTQANPPLAVPRDYICAESTLRFIHSYLDAQCAH